MKRASTVVALLIAFSGCTSGLFAEEATEQVDKAELLLLQETLNQGARAQATFYVENSRFAANITELNMTVPERIAITVTQQSIGDYCMAATHESLESGVWHVSSQETVPAEGGC